MMSSRSRLPKFEARQSRLRDLQNGAANAELIAN